MPVTLPPPGALSNSNISTASMKVLIEDLRNKIAQLVGGTLEGSLTIASGLITPGSEDTGRPKGTYAVDTEGAGATDDLVQISTVNYENGSIIRIRCAHDTRSVVVKQGGGGAGEIGLETGVDFTLRSTKQWLTLQLRGSTWVEMDRSPLVQSGVSGVRNLVGTNNSGTPTTQYDWQADVVTLRNPSDGSTVTRVGTGTVTTNVSTAGPAVNGRDQAGAFSPNSWLHFYWIWNGVTLGTLASLAVPPTGPGGPTLPTGYTHWAYIGAQRFSGSSQFFLTRVRGGETFYVAQQGVLTGGTSTSAAAVSVASVVPPNALTYTIADTGWAVTTDGSGVLIADLEIHIVSGSIHTYLARPATSGLATASSSRTMGGAQISVPNIGQQFFYKWTVTNGSSPSASIAVPSYRVANGE